MLEDFEDQIDDDPWDLNYIASKKKDESKKPANNKVNDKNQFGNKDIDAFKDLDEIGLQLNENPIIKKEIPKKSNEIKVIEKANNNN